MRYKRNDATTNRPDGDRLIDAPYLFLDLDEAIRQLKEEAAWEKNDRNGITLFKTGNLSTVLVGLHENAVLSKQPVDGIFTLQILAGKVRVHTNDGDADLKANQLITFHSCIEHSIEALDDSFILLSIDTGLHKERE